MVERPYSHVLITRPLPEANDLSARLTPLMNSLGMKSLVQPAQTFTRLPLGEEEKFELRDISEPGESPGLVPELIIFSSPRAVEFGLEQIPSECLRRFTLAAMGPATASSLAKAGYRVDVNAEGPHDSEAMLAALLNRFGKTGIEGAMAYVVAAEGGRKDLSNWLKDRGCRVRFLFVYARGQAELDDSVMSEILVSTRVLTVWTSGNAINTLSQKMPPAAWFKLCQGEWLVISKRLQRLARAFRPAAIHLSAGPSNDELVAAVRNLVLRG
jgi:uroporphyrinogen-III synthase